MRHRVLNLVPLLLVAGCADPSATSLVEANAPLAQVNQSRILHKVSVGGPDICSGLSNMPGCDANLSLIAFEWEDRTVTGQLIDQYGDAEGLQATVDCLLVQVIPGRTTLEAWVGGVVTRPPHQAGNRVLLRVRDNATSVNDPPPPDAITRAIVDPEREGLSPNCLDKSLFTFNRAPQGQVTIW